MLKHVAVSPHRSRADSVSLSSTASFCSVNGANGPGSSHSMAPATESLHSRSSSYTSLNDASSSSTHSFSSRIAVNRILVPQQEAPANTEGGEEEGVESLLVTTDQTTIKVYARCLRPDIEYKTLSVTFGTTSREVVSLLLGKYKMRHRDPKLFYLTMEVTVRQAGVRTVLVLDDSTKPAALQSCHPKGYSKFSLQMRRGGLVKIYDSALMSSSQYKSLLISDRTTADELLAILLNCYSSSEKVEQFSLYEVCKSQEYQRKLHPDDLPLRVQQSWQASDRQNCHFLVRRNPDYRALTRRKQLMWSPDFQTSTKEMLQLSSLQDTLQSFSSLNLNDTTNFPKNAQTTPDKEKTIEKTHNRSIDTILDETCDKWGNYVNLKRTENPEKSHSYNCDKKPFSCETCNPPVTPKSNITASKSCHQIGCYSPVYRYPSISYCSVTQECKSFDSNSLSSVDSSDIVTSTPIQSPSNMSNGELFFASINSSVARITSITPSAAPRTKFQNSRVEYENYFYI